MAFPPLDEFRNRERFLCETCGDEARLIERVAVDERFEGDPVLQGEVLVFELLDHPEATRCYAWEVAGRVTAVLGVSGVDSAVKAVRASILAEGEQGSTRPQG